MAQEIQGTHYVGEVAQKAFIVEDGKVLMCRAFGFTRWDFPGGRIHREENPHEGLLREVKEELGVEIEIKRPFSVSVTDDTPNGMPRYFILFEAFLKDPGAEFVLAPDEIEEIRWVSLEDVSTIETWKDWKVILEDYYHEHP